MKRRSDFRYKVGDPVESDTFGVGKIVSVDSMGHIYTIQWSTGGEGKFFESEIDEFFNPRRFGMSLRRISIELKRASEMLAQLGLPTAEETDLSLARDAMISVMQGIDDFSNRSQLATDVELKEVLTSISTVSKEHVAKLTAWLSAHDAEQSNALEQELSLSPAPSVEEESVEEESE